MKNLKGGYQLIDLQGNDLSSGFTLEGLHQVITLSNNKPLLVTGIVISGTKKNDVYTTYTKSGTNYYVVVYDKKLKVANTDAVTITDYTPYDPDRVDLINNEAWGLSTSGTLTSARLEKVKENPNLILKMTSDANSSIALCYFYPCGYSAFDSSSYYKFYAVTEASGSIKIHVLKIAKTGGAYTVTTKTLS